MTRQAAGETRSNQSVGYVKPLHLYDCSDRILQIALVVIKYPNLVYIKGARRQRLSFNYAEQAIFETI